METMIEEQTDKKEMNKIIIINTNRGKIITIIDRTQIDNKTQTITKVDNKEVTP